MRYNELRDTLLRALRDSRFRVIGRPSETIDLTTTTRRYETFLEDVAVQRAEPFYVAASVAFQWDPFESARTYTNEDDLISELLGRNEETIDTMPRSLRVDFVLKASLSYEIQVPLLGVDRWRSWASRDTRKPPHSSADGGARASRQTHHGHRVGRHCGRRVGVLGDG